MSDAAEAVERIVSRRQLQIDAGDVLIVRTAGGISRTSRAVYHLRVSGKGQLPERFANFDHAVAAGNVIAGKTRVRLFYIESEHEPPYLIQDFRPDR